MISTLSGGGAEGVCVNLANSFANDDWQVDLVILNLHEEAYLKRLSDKVNLIVLNVNHARFSILPLLKYIHKNKIKTILVFNYELAVILVILRLIFRLKIKIISRNINTLTIKIKQFEKQNLWTRVIVKNLVKYFYNKADHVVNQCDAMRDDLLSYFPELYRNSSTIYNPIPLHILKYTKNHNTNQIKKKIIFCALGVLKNKKHSILQ